MSEPINPLHQSSDCQGGSTVEQFLQAVEAKTTDPIHRRLLLAARNDNSLANLEAELHKIISEIINAN